MTIEIKELVIRASIGKAQDNTGEGRVSSMSSGDEERIVRSCVEQVLEILKRKKER